MKITEKTERNRGMRLGELRNLVKAADKLGMSDEGRVHARLPGNQTGAPVELSVDAFEPEEEAPDAS